MQKRKKSTAAWATSPLVWYGIPIFIIALVVWAMWPERHFTPQPAASVMVPPPAQQTQMPPYGDKEHELTLQYCNFLAAATNPGLPENSYMPPGLKTRINWISDKHKQGKMEVACAKALLYPDGTPMPTSTLMSSKFDGNKYSIGILAPRLYPFVWQNGNRVPTTITQVWKNNFATGIAHEVIHLENEKFQLKQPPATPEERFSEELRAHIVTAREIIGPLRDMKQDVYIEDIQKDNAARKCNYQLPCKPLEDLLHSLK